MANDEFQPQPSSSDEGAARSLASRIRTVLGKDAARLPEPFDARDPIHIDAAARPLLRRFYERAESRCFDLLIELTADVLAPVALDVVREIGLPVAPDVLLGAYYGALFCDTRPAQVDVRTMIAFSERRLHDLAEARVRWIAKRPIPHLERLPSGLPAPRAPYPGAPFDSDPPEDPVAIDALVHASGTSAVAASIDFDQLGFDFTWLVETLFHRLDQPTRVLLRAAEIEGKSSAEIADRDGVSPSQVTERLDVARAALAHSIEDVCSRLAHKARRAGCTLADTRPEDITAEDVAKHLVACDACVKSLDAVSAQREALVVLESPRDPGTSRVAALVAEAKGKGREAVKKLLFELLRGVLASIPEVAATTRFVVQPKNLEATREALIASIHRTAPDTPVPGSSDRSMLAAHACLRAVGVAVGQSDPDYLLYRALLASRDGDLELAQSVLEDLLLRHPRAVNAYAARRNLLRVLADRGLHENALSHADAMIRAGDDPRQVHYVRSTTYAALHDAKSFFESALAFRDSHLVAHEAAIWCAFIRADAPIMSEQLGLEIPSIHEALGLSGLEAVE